MRVLSLFAGMGGFDLAFEMAGFDVVAQVEIDSYCQRILRHHFPQAKLYGDIRRVTGEQITGDCGAIDVVCGGFPCQDISQAGKGAGLEGERSGLWWEMHRIIKELRPTWVVAENVSALRTRGLDRVKASLEELDYTVECLGIRALTVGAPHERKRLWIIAHANSPRVRQQPGRQRRQTRQSKTELVETCKELGDTESKRVGKPDDQTATISASRQARNVFTGTSSPVGVGYNPDSHGGQAESITGNTKAEISTACNYSPFRFPAGFGEPQSDWEQPRTIESRLGIAANGLPRKLALRAIGNSIVPAIAYGIARTIERIERTQG